MDFQVAHSFMAQWVSDAMRNSVKFLRSNNGGKFRPTATSDDKSIDSLMHKYSAPHCRNCILVDPSIYRQINAQNMSTLGSNNPKIAVDNFVSQPRKVPKRDFSKSLDQKKTKKGWKTPIFRTYYCCCKFLFL